MGQMSDGEKLFLAVVAFLLLKGLIDAKDAQDREKVRGIWKRYREGQPGPSGGPKKPKKTGGLFPWS